MRCAKFPFSRIAGCISKRSFGNTFKCHFSNLVRAPNPFPESVPAALPPSPAPRGAGNQRTANNIVLCAGAYILLQTLLYGCQENMMPHRHEIYDLEAGA